MDEDRNIEADDESNDKSSINDIDNIKKNESTELDLINPKNITSIQDKIISIESEDSQKKRKEKIKQKVKEKYQNIKTKVKNKNEKKPNNNIPKISEKDFLINKFSYHLLSISNGLSQFSSLSLMYFFKDVLKVTPSELSIINAITLSPMIIKPLFGLLSDLYPLLGYRRKYYIIICGVLQSLVWMVMLGINKSIISSVLCMIVSTSCSSFQSVLAQAIATQISRYERLIKGETSSVNELLIFQFVGMLISNILRAIVAQYFQIKTVFIIAVFLPLIGIISGFIYKEEKIINNDITNNNNSVRNNLKINNKIIKKSSSGINSNKKVNHLSINMFFTVVKDKKILVPLFLLLILSISPSYMDSTFYYLTEIKNFAPNSFGILTIIMSGCMILTTIIYNKCFNKCKYIKLFICCVLLISSLCSCLFNLWIIFDWSYKFIVFIAISLYVSIKQIASMPIMNLGCAVCPKNYEGSIYSLFSSSLIFGRTLSTLGGSLLMKIFNVGVGKYENFNVMIFVSNLLVLLPSIFIIFTPIVYLQIQQESNEISNTISNN